MKARQTLIHYRALCLNCAARCDAKNATAWAHNHIAHHPSHRVELSLGYSVTAQGRTEPASEQGSLKV